MEHFPYRHAREGPGPYVQRAMVSAPDCTLLPSQLPGGVRNHLGHQPERALVLAVLEEAVHTFAGALAGEGLRARRLLDECLEWFHDDTQAYFGFAWCCDQVGWDPAAVRAALQRTYDHRQRSRRRATWR